MADYFVATLRSDDFRTVKTIARLQSQWDWTKVQEEGMVTSMWEVTGVRNSEQAIAGVIENAIGVGQCVTCVKPHQRDRRYLLNILANMLVLTRGEGEPLNVVQVLAQMVRETIFKAEGLQEDKP